MATWRRKKVMRDVTVTAPSSLDMLREKSEATGRSVRAEVPGYCPHTKDNKEAVCEKGSGSYDH